MPTNNIGAPSTWDPVAQAALNYMPTPSGPTASALNNNYPNLQPNNKYQYLTSIKIDHYIGEKWHLSGYYIAEYSDKDNADDGINTIGRPDPLEPDACPAVVSQCGLYGYAETGASRRLRLYPPRRAAGFVSAKLQSVDSWVEHVGKYARRRRETFPIF